MHKLQEEEIRQEARQIARHFSSDFANAVLALSVKLGEKAEDVKKIFLDEMAKE